MTTITILVHVYQGEYMDPSGMTLQWIIVESPFMKQKPPIYWLTRIQFGFPDFALYKMHPYLSQSW